MSVVRLQDFSLEVTSVATLYLQPSSHGSRPLRSVATWLHTPSTTMEQAYSLVQHTASAMNSGFKFCDGNSRPVLDMRAGHLQAVCRCCSATCSPNLAPSWSRPSHLFTTTTSPTRCPASPWRDF
jgi:hypothetical protein